MIERMKVMLFGRNAKDLRELVRSSGFEEVSSNPDMVFSYGGDGTLMESEFVYPGVPKVMLKDSAVCKRCMNLPNDEIIAHLARGEYSIEELPKLFAAAGGREITAMNDIVLHNDDPRHAIRYQCSINGTQVGNELIGDGIVVATPFGSSGYYRSITDSVFEVGFGVAFNNSTEQVDHVVVRESSEIRCVIRRGPAELYADNQREKIVLRAGGEIVIRRAASVARLVRT